MSDLIIDKKNITQLLTDKYEKLGQGWITLLELPVEDSMKVNTEAIRILQSLGYEGIYISLSKDYIELSKILGSSGVDLGKLAFIDGISQMYGIKEVTAPNVTYVAGPLSIDAISRTVEKIAPTITQAKKFVFLDSITTVLLYNSLERTMEFTKFLTSTLKKLQLVGIVVSVSRGFANEALLIELTKVSNEVIRIQAVEIDKS